MKTVIEKYLLQIIIVCAVLLTYGHTVLHDYAGDDVIVILDNDRVLSGLSDFSAFFKNIKSDQTQHRYGYRPISLISFAMDVEFFGQDPFWSHLHNVLLYLIACLLCFQLLKKLLPIIENWVIGFAVLVYTLHPLHTEVVANIKSRDEILALIFGVLFLLHLNRFQSTKNWRNGMLACLFILLGFLSKENAIGYSISGVFLVLLKPSLSIKTFLKKAIFPIGTTIGLLMVFYFSQLIIEDNSVDLLSKGILHEDRFAANPLVDAGIFDRIINAVFLIGLALKLYLFPYPLVHDYGIGVLPLITSLTDIRFTINLLLIVLISAFSLRWRKKHPTLVFGWCVFLSTYFIFLSIVRVGPDLFGERYLFGSSLGLSMMLIPLVQNLKGAMKLVLVGICLVLAYSSFQRAKAWKNNETLFSTDKAFLDDCARFQFNYAQQLHFRYYEVGPDSQANLIPQILKHYERSLEITDRIPKVHVDLGRAYMEFGYPDKAESVFLGFAEKYDHLSAPYQELGKFHISNENYISGIQALDLGIAKGPANTELYYLKAICQIKKGDTYGAQLTLQKGKENGIISEEYQQLMNKF